jgi:uncharacterized protein with FMN-binding domain
MKQLLHRTLSIAVPVPLVLWLALLITTPTCAGGDVVEFLSGARVEGTVIQIDKEHKQITFEAEIAGRKLNRVYRYNQIHAVTYQDKRYVLNEKTDNPAANADGGASSAPGGSQTGSGRASRAAVEALVRQSGESAPDWFDNVALNYPRSLDLGWPEKAPEGWNNQKNVGQYIWDVINPNPNQWQGGVKLLHHLLEVNQGDPRTVQRIMNELGRMYHDLLEDYPRAAYWWRRAGADRGAVEGRSGPQLAECYWRMGNREMALELLEKLARSDNGGTLVNCVKVWTAMGEIGKAETLVRRLAPAYEKQGVSPGEIYLLLGDAYRSSGNYAQAQQWYQRTAALSDGLKGRIQKQKERAQASLVSLSLFEKSDVARVADGTYRASSLGYEDLIHVEVVVRNHQIQDVRVTQHREKQFYSSISDTTAKIIDKNSVQGVDTTSSATITSEAIIDATAKALASGAN